MNNIRKTYSDNERSWDYTLEQRSDTLVTNNMLEAVGNALVGRVTGLSCDLKSCLDDCMDQEKKVSILDRVRAA